MKKDKDELLPTGFGMLLFGKQPRNTLRQAGLLASITYPDGEKERKEFDEPAVLIPDLLEKWLKDKLPNVFDRNQMQREERPALPFEMIREAVVNALIHRNYDIEGGKCQLAVDTDTVTVRSPGAPTPPITLEQMQNFTAPMLSRNPSMHFVFARMGMAEEQGLGLASLRNRARQQNLPLPVFTWDDPYLVLTLYRSSKAAVETLDEGKLEELSKAERLGWEWLVTRDSVTTAEYQEAMNLPNRTAKNHMKKFTDLGLLVMVGSARATQYKVARNRQ